jgi:two-component system sensor histidine kinase and response regulator WspE
MSDNLSLMDLFREEVRSHAAALNQGLVELEGEGGNPQRIEPLMRAAHSIKGAARIVNVDPAVHLAHALEDALVAAQEGRTRIGAGEIDVCLRATDALASLGRVNEAEISAWAASHEVEITGLKTLLRSIAQGQAALAATPAVAAPAPAPAPQATLPAVAAPTPAIPPTTMRGDGASQASPVAPPVQTEAAEAVVRVTAQSLTRLMGLAGESLVQARWLHPFAISLTKLKKLLDHLVALQDNLEQAVRGEGNNEGVAGLVADARRQAARCRQLLAERISDFEGHAAQAEDLNGRLYREVIASRMRPFADGAVGFPRLVRDTARRLEKQARLEIIGPSTEVDRDILERLEAPLTHLLRNAVDHGIEKPAERRAAGKPEMGRVRLEVQHRAGTLAITVSDDGSGINLDRLRRKVVERGLTPADMAHSLGEGELLQFLFLPGFSTAAAVSEISGRGVGLDVVQDVVRRVGGSVRIRTHPGQGTSFHLQVPITLSVLRAVLVDIAGEPYAFPHNRIDRLLRVARGAVRSLENRQFITVDGQNVGLVVAAQLLELAATPAGEDELAVLLLSDPTGQYGLAVDAFRGEQDLVVRPLDSRLGRVPDINAAAILDDGSPVLIADVEDLIRSMDRLIQAGSLERSRKNQTGATGPRKRVLVVDDSITVREVERHLLRQHGFEVDIAVDGQEGWNRVRAERFDLVVSDIDMPRMNGLDLVRAIRQDGSLKDLPVIIVSYKDREEDRLRGLEVGANSYLTKTSFHNNTFLQAVTDLIGEA